MNPLWVKDAIYKVLDSDLIQEAKFHPNQFKYIWDEYQPKLLEKGVKTLGEKRKYSSEEHEQLLALMLAYEFCYEQKNFRGEPYYIIPALFGDKPSLPENLQKFDYEIKFEYNPFIPAGTVNKLIVRLHQIIYNDLTWKNGVIFIDTQNFAFAEVQEVWQAKTVYLKLKGQKIKPLYNRIYQTLLDLNQHLKDTKFLAKLEFKTLVKYKNQWRSLIDVIDFGIEEYDFVLRGSLKKEKSIKQSNKPYLLDLINKLELVEVFEKLDELGIKHYNLAKLQDEFIGGDYNSSFPQRLRLFINSLDLD